MLFALPSPEILYAALLARDDRYDGRAFVCVVTTGIFCRLSCPARKPRFENCQFRDSPAACIAAGYRPCLRCRPLSAMIGDDPVVARLLAALDAAPERRWTEADITAMDLDPSTVRRNFRRNFGMTFLAMARSRRLQAGMRALGEAGRVIDAQVTAGFDSASAFRDAVTRLLGRAPAALRRSARLRIDWIGTPLGPMVAVADETAIHLLEFIDRAALATELTSLVAAATYGMQIGRWAVTDRLETELDCFFSGRDARFTVAIAQPGSAFSHAVWAAPRAIPPGETRSYREIAVAVGRPDALRAVARANGANRIALVVPCHRVIGADGSLTGYGGGLWRKRRLIELECGYLGARPASASAPGNDRPDISLGQEERRIAS
ncbi:bifunctional transcriptional activator/DNA repair enzyme AdaA [Methylobacterium sp. JK268]